MWFERWSWLRPSIGSEGLLRSVAIIQARMGSTRLPGKVLMDLEGQTVLSRVVRRLSRAKLITETTIATTNLPGDEAIAVEAKRLGVRCFRGSEQDVLARYAGAAEEFAADIVVRVTSDCPLIDAGVVDQVLHEFQRAEADFAYNDVEHSFARGLDAEAFSRQALNTAAQVAHAQYQREHVTPLFYERPDMFKTAIVHAERNFSHYRWTLDTPEDLNLIRAIYRYFAGGDDFRWHDVVALMEQAPELARINAHVAQKPLHEMAAS